MLLPQDYVERVYAGVLGKIIGVYLGRPFEGWGYEKILAELGEVWYYVHERLQKPLIVTDDDITGTFTFVRAMAENNNTPDLTPEQIGQYWLNAIIENKSILWWGGMGNSTEHTAYLRLKSGIPAPQSGCMALNSKVVAEQIGAQIFIDGWAMLAPNDPVLAADYARRAGSVSHDGEAIYGAQMLAAMEAAAFGEPDLNKLLEIGLAQIPADSVIAAMIGELRRLRAVEPDWKKAFVWLREHYGYDRYGGNCHMVPNHGLMILSLLWGDDDFQKTLMICNTCGWDTDCNSGNIGCLMGIKNGLAGIDAGPDWRGPVADRMYLPAADGGRVVSDAVLETYAIVNSGRALQGLAPLAPKDGARFHFDLSGSVQGFCSEDSVESAGLLTIENAEDVFSAGERCLALRFAHLTAGRYARAATATFIPPQALQMPGYDLTASPTLYPGQTVKTLVKADAHNPDAVMVCLYTRAYQADGLTLERVYGPAVLLAPGQQTALEWKITQAHYQPIAEIGFELRSEKAISGAVYVDSLGWSGTPQVVLLDETHQGTVSARRPWVNALDWELSSGAEPLRMVQNTGRGMILQGTREWQGYTASALVNPHLAKACGLAVHAQGLRRYYALLLESSGKARLVKMFDTETTLAEMLFDLQFDRLYQLQLGCRDGKLQGWVDGELLLTAEDYALQDGALGLIVEEGRLAVLRVEVSE